MASSILLISSCSHKQVMVHKNTDYALTCSDISVEMAEVERVVSEIHENTGGSGRNVGMALFFWPGVIVNQMNAGDARKMASERMSVLANLRKERGCNEAQSKSSSTPESKIEAVQNTVEQKEEKAVVETVVQNSEVKAEVK